MTKVVREFNVNEHVWVKLTEEGREALRRNYEELYKNFSSIKPEYKSYYKEEDGWTEMQMWVFMKELGQHITMGFKAPFETTIRIVFDEEAGN